MSIEQMPSQSWEAWKGIVEECMGETPLQPETKVAEAGVVILPYDGADAFIPQLKRHVISDERANLPA